MSTGKDLIRTTGILSAGLLLNNKKLWTNKFAGYWQKDHIFSPAMEVATRSNLQKNWKRAVKAAQAWTEE